MSISAVSLSEVGGLNPLIAAASRGFALGPLRASAAAVTAPCDNGGTCEPASPIDDPWLRGERTTARRRAVDAEPVSGTAYQRNSDGDDATLSSLESKLTPKELEEVRTLRKRDAEVRTHEQAHMAQAGGYAQGVSYEFKVGPDGKRYAVGGSVQIDTSPVPGDPAATIAKAQTIRRAALAPGEPSGQDRSVAARAARMEADAKAELAKKQNEPGASAKGLSEPRAEATGSSEPKAPATTDRAPTNLSRLIDVVG